MMKRIVVTVFAAAMIFMPAVVVPAIFTPAAAQVVVSAPYPGYVWAARYRGWEGHRYYGWAPHRWWYERHHERFGYFGWHGHRYY